MERVHKIIVSGDKKIFSDDKINFLLPPSVMHMRNRGKMEDKVDKIRITVHFGAKRWREKLVCNCGMNRVALYHLAHLFLGRSIKINPCDIFVRIFGEHTCKC